MAHFKQDEKSQTDMLVAFQYAANAFGDFINNIESSSLGDSTLIAGYGDHQMRGINATYPKEQMLDHSVPFYLYVPKKILEHSQWKFDPTRIGSHKDVMPTLYSYSLSNTKYWAIGGRNMLAPVDDVSRAFGYNVNLWMDEKGVYTLSNKTTFYPWQNTDYLGRHVNATTVSDLQLKSTPEVVSDEQQKKNALLCKITLLANQ